MSTHIQGYFEGYMNKQANPLSALTAGAGVAKATAGGAANLLPILLALPVIAGAGTGMIHSKVTSPSPLDAQSAQKELELAELEEFVTDLQRRREASMSQGDQEEPRARALRI